MNLIYGIITCRRPEYFKGHMDTLIKTMDHSHDWHIIIADDSTICDYTAQYVRVLQDLRHKVTVIRSKFRGPHYLVNQILRIASKEKFDYGFMAEDDIFFSAKEWDNLYIKSIQLSSFDYLCYFSSKWALGHHRGPCVLPVIKELDKKIQSEVKIFDCFGCFWTFSLSVIKNVGYFDMNNLGVWGNGHTDYSIRCCRSGFNGKHGRIFDMLGSENYIRMQSNGYASVASVVTDGKGIDCGMIGVPDGKHKSMIMAVKNRAYVPYNVVNLNMLGQII